jgi:DNA-binding XRE family transcriptional regulator
MWKAILDYENLYQISDTTIIKRIKGKRCREDRIIKPWKNGKYLYIRLCKDGKGKIFPVHRLMFETFIGPCPLGMEICHNNNDSTNNLIWNLRSDTHSNNCLDKRRHGTTSDPIWLDNRGSKHGRAKLNEEKVIEIKKLLQEGKLTQITIAKIYNVSRRTISSIKNNKTWKHVSIN